MMKPKGFNCLNCKKWKKVGERREGKSIISMGKCSRNKYLTKHYEYCVGVVQKEKGREK